MGRSLWAYAVLVAVAIAGCKKPASGPDLSTPKAAAVTFTSALERGDTATARLACSAGGIEQDLVDSMAISASGLRRLETVAAAKFGDDAKLLIAMETQAPIAKKMAEGDVEQNAMIATIRSKDGKDTLQLKNVDGQWKVDIGALIRGQDISQVVPMFRAVGKAAQQVADEIDSGKCKTVAEARAAMGQRMENARKEEVRLLMESATKPSAAESTGAAGK